METSEAGRKMIQGFEGLRLKAYLDVVGVVTIGYGHTGPDINIHTVWTQAHADMALVNRLTDEFEPVVDAISYENGTTQKQYDAMVCLAYNIGANGFARSTVARRHAAFNYQGAADAFRMWNKAGGKVLPPLARRREVERQVYLGGAYPR